MLVHIVGLIIAGLTYWGWYIALASVEVPPQRKQKWSKRRH